MKRIRLGAALAALLVLAGCDVRTTYEELADRCEAMGGVYFGQNNHLCIKRSAVISRAALERPAPTCTGDRLCAGLNPEPAYPNGEPCGTNKACAAFSKRRDALACADGRLARTEPACVEWSARSREARQ